LVGGVSKVSLKQKGDSAFIYKGEDLLAVVSGIKKSKLEKSSYGLS